MQRVVVVWVSSLVTTHRAVREVGNGCRGIRPIIVECGFISHTVDSPSPAPRQELIADSRVAVLGPKLTFSRASPIRTLFWPPDMPGVKLVSPN